MNLRNLVIFSLLFFCCEQNQSKNQRDNNLEYNPEKRLEQLGIKIPEVSPPVANYVRVVKSGNLLFLSGSGPKKADGSYITGKLGKELTIEDGYQAAWLTGVNHIATLKSENKLVNYTLQELSFYTKSYPVSRGLDHPNEISAYMFSEFFKSKYNFREPFQEINEDSKKNVELFLEWIKSDMR